MNDWLKRVFSESNGTPSSGRLLLGIAVFGAVASVAYVLCFHFLKGTMTDIPTNAANLLSWVVGALSGAKAAGKFAEGPPSH